METFTIELIFNVAAQFYRPKTFSSFKNFLPEQLNLEGQWEVRVSELTYPLMYQNVTEGMFMFFDEKFQTRLNFTIWKPLFTLPLQMLLRPWKLSFKRNAITVKAVSQLKCLEERKNLRYTLQMEDLVFPSLVQTWETF